MEDVTPLQQLLKGNGVPYYAMWVREGMRRTGIYGVLDTPANLNLAEAVASYFAIVAATFAMADEEAHHKRHEAIARFVHHVGGPMGATVGNIHKGDTAAFLSSFYLLKPSTSDLCGLARENYVAANSALSEVTLSVPVFFGLLGNNIEGIVEALASVSKEVVKPGIRIEPFLAVLGSTRVKPREGAERYGYGSVLMN